jgi:hypothetical protein
MRTERENLVFRVSMAVSKGIGSMRGVRQLNEEQRKRVAETIVHELETNWKIVLSDHRKVNGLSSKTI